MATEHATGARAPITDPDGWEVVDGIIAWMMPEDPTGIFQAELGPFVILEGPDGSVVAVPRDALAVLARGLLAAHVDAARTDRWPR